MTDAPLVVVRGRAPAVCARRLRRWCSGMRAGDARGDACACGGGGSWSQCAATRPPPAHNPPCPPPPSPTSFDRTGNPFRGHWSCVRGCGRVWGLGRITEEQDGRRAGARAVYVDSRNVHHYSRDDVGDALTPPLRLRGLYDLLLAVAFGANSPPDRLPARPPARLHACLRSRDWRWMLRRRMSTRIKHS